MTRCAICGQRYVQPPAGTRFPDLCGTCVQKAEVKRIEKRLEAVKKAFRRNSRK